jgi:exopolysaccharide biosynthesis polyprenyl glycosylphosphotransferase
MDVGIGVLAGSAILAVTRSAGSPDELSGWLSVQLSVRDILLVVIFGIAWAVLCATMGRGFSAWRTRLVALTALAAGGCAAGVGLASPDATADASTLALFILAGTTAATASVRLVGRSLMHTRGQRQQQQVVIVGSGPRAVRVLHSLRAQNGSAPHVLGFVDSYNGNAQPEAAAAMLGSLDQLEQILMRQVVDEVIIALPIRSCYQHVQDALIVCERMGVEARYLADVFEAKLARPLYQPSPSMPAFALKVVADDYRLIIKRIVDVLGSAAAIIVLAPLFIVLAIAIKATSRGPVFFVHERFGLNKRRFRLYKFRTMVAGAEALQAKLEEQNEARGPVFKIRRDPRVTTLGRFLRRTSLDELPQLWNVLRGDMSLVGPRPLPDRDVLRFSEAWLMRRFSVLPGLTGLWQISGRSDLPFDEWMRLDLEYIDKWSLRLDARILLHTLPAVIGGRGAS